MAATPQQQLDALNNAIVQNAVKVRLPDGSEITYRSLSEVMAARETILLEVNAAAGNPMYNDISFRRPM
jgi:hypothetical protein